MTPGKAHTAGYCLTHRLGLLLVERTHRPDRDDQVELRQSRGVVERVKRIGHVHLELSRAQQRGTHIANLLRLMAVPAAPYNQRLSHASSFLSQKSDPPVG